MPRITLVMPYYNEARFIEATLASLMAQEARDFRLVLIDNGSTDGSEAIARAVCRNAGMTDVVFLSEPKPGKLHALMTGLAMIETEFVATLDADTNYPPGYVSRCLALFDANPRASSVMAIDLYDPADSARGLAQRRRVAFAARMFRAKCHTGAYGQAFRTAAYRASGGYDIDRWPYVLEDHELIYRIMWTGPSVYDRDHFCFPSDRRSDRGNVNWTLLDQIAYLLVPKCLLSAYFNRYLGPRLERRGLRNINLREQNW